jgi:hypothetical protein
VPSALTARLMSLTGRTRALDVPRTSWGAGDVLALIGLPIAGLALSLVTVIRRPDLVKGADFLFLDAGHNLLVADRLLSGHWLYRDVFYQYGRLAAYVYTAVAFLFGNTPTTYLVLLAGISALNMSLGYAVVRRAADTATAVLVSIGLIALVPVPGALAGGFTVSPYLVLERTVLLLVALCWRPVGRSWRSSLSLGAALGLWQGVKFGGGIVAGCAIVLLDVLYLLAMGSSRAQLRAWVQSLLLVAVAFFAIELIWVGLAFRTGPPALALDTIFPFYMYGTYSVVTPDIRWPLWNGWRLAVGQYLLPFSAGVLGVIGLVGWLRRIRRGTSADIDQAAVAGGIFVPLLFYVVSTVTYFRHVYHFQQFLWALVPAAAWQLQRLPLRLRAAALLPWAPGVLLVFRAAFLTTPSTSLEVIALPTGGSIVVDSKIKARLTLLSNLAAEGAVLYVPLGSGWHFAYQMPLATKYSWFFAPNVIRPYDRSDFIRSLDGIRAIVACDPHGSQSGALSSIFPLPREISAQIYSRLELRKTEAGCRVYRVRHEA